MPRLHESMMLQGTAVGSTLLQGTHAV